MVDIPLGVSVDPATVAVRSIHAMASGHRSEFVALYHPTASDRENAVQPPGSRRPGPDGFWSTALWLRDAFSGLRYEIHHTVASGELVAVNSTMCGTHTSPYAVYAEDGELDTVFPPTGHEFRATQSHWFRVQDGLIREHWANRDDLGMAQQLGWVPPSPVFLVRMAAAKRRTRRTAGH